MTEGKIAAKHIIVSACMVIISYLFQTAVFSNLKLAGISPNFMVILTTSWGLICGRKRGMLMGIVCGFILDFFSGAILGIYALIFLYLGYFSGVCRKLFYGDDLKLPLLFIGINDMFYGFIIYFLYFFLRGKYTIMFYFMNIIMPEVIYTVLVSLFAYYVIYKIHQWMEKDTKRSNRRLV